MTATNRADRYAVMGNPIEHSKSPLIHRLFAEQTGQDLVYEAILVDPEGFAEAVTDFIGSAGKGLNVTVPFKQEAWKIADQLSERAQRAGAVNTLQIGNDGKLSGDNTDGVGLVRDLTSNLGLTLTGKQILVLGAGGAVRGILAPLLEQNPSRLLVANRTVGRAQQLATEFSDLGELQGCGFDDLKGTRFDIIINATAAGLQGQVPELPDGIIDSGSCCYDLVYASEPTAFVHYARQHGVQAAFDGLGMLVEQAAESFRIWRGVAPDTAPVIAALRNQ
ncbi:MAG: shikimate dehydrogenase [Gammaproteobacteria bacterium]|nr:MAG: shikimate dehydrogenase [Gammaproteobacteria bacterium]